MDFCPFLTDPVNGIPEFQILKFFVYKRYYLFPANLMIDITPFSQISSCIRMTVLIVTNMEGCFIGTSKEQTFGNISGK